jgi:hypothetical protein
MRNPQSLSELLPSQLIGRKASCAIVGINAEESIMDRDTEHLRLLSIFHNVLGGISAFYSLFALFYQAIGMVFLSP